MRQIAEKEIARKEEISKTLDYMCQQLGQLGVIYNIPEDLEHQFVINRAIDVRSASMLHVALQINHDGMWFGTVGVNRL